MLARGDLAADAPALRLPVLVMVGGADRVTPPEKVAAIAAQIPGADFQMIPQAGHASYADRETEYTSRVGTFIGE
jgi:3-oxoadipate enol-lactonase